MLSISSLATLLLVQAPHKFRTLTLTSLAESLPPDAEVVQVYAEPPPGGPLPRPPRELKAFGKVFLQLGESNTVEMEINVADLAAWDPAQKQWQPAAGEYALRTGDSSRELPLKIRLEL